MTNAQLIVKTLEAFGVDAVFGYPGAHTAAIHDALIDSPIRHVLVRHEQAAGFMADGYARATGKVGVCLTTAGPGATNAATAIASAYSDSVPVLHLTAHVASKHATAEDGAFHEMDLVRVFEPMTKWASQPATPDDVPRLLMQALEQVQTGRPRPVFLALPHDLLTAEAAKDVRTPPPPCRSEPHASAIAAAAEAIAAARQLMLLVGGGAISAGASSELTAFAERLGAPVAATTMGRGAFAEDHPLALGWVRSKPAQAALLEADLLIAVGCRFGEISTSGWSMKPPDLIHIDIDASVIGHHYTPRVGIVADAQAALGALIRTLPVGLRKPWLTQALPAGEPREGLDGEIVPIMRKVLDRDAIVAADVGMTVWHFFTRFPFYEPRTFLHSARYITMGHALPAALGAKVAHPQRQVVCVAGDGGFMMTCAELATAVQERIAVPIVVVNDGQLGVIKHIQKRDYQGRYIAVDIFNPDFGKLAESFGVPHVRIEAAGAFAPALRRALDADGPTLIEVVKQGIG